ncbi:MAG: SpoIIE family protein phosphatase [Desulfobacterales bacterium]|nr:SpoIIE family protein phosphatase [Desulfobacterales bacterium]
MKIRPKLFLVLVVFSLVPLVGVTLINQYGTRRMGAVISENVGQTFTHIADRALNLTAQKSAASLASSKLAVEFALMGLVEAAEAALAREPSLPTAVFFARDFENAATAPPDSGPHPALSPASVDSRASLGRVSLGQPSFWLPAGAPREGFDEEIGRLSTLTGYLQKSFDRLGKKMLWSYVSLESGLHMAFPGHGGYPAGYDPRRRPWYQGAARQTAWSFPMVDATTGQVIMTAYQQIRRGDGTLAGAAAIDILISEMLQVADLSAVWSPQMRSFLVTLQNSDPPSSPGLLIIAQMDYQASAPCWEGAIRPEMLSTDRPEQLARLTSEIDSGRSGFMQMPFKGVDSLWAFAPIGAKTSFVIVVPTALIEGFKENNLELVRAYTREELVATALAALVLIGLATLAAYFGSRNITQPILALAAAAERLSRGDFSTRIGLRTGDERDHVIQAFNEMVPRLEDNLRLSESLRLATEVQQNLLPGKDPCVPGLDISGISLYCDETGGDYFDFLDIREDRPGRIGIAVGDVSGHGLCSALLMASARASLRLRSDMPGTLSLVIADVNRRFCQDVADSGAFMTLFYLVADSRRQSLSWVRAGHDPAIVYDPAADRIELLSGRGAALGLSPGLVFEENEKLGLRPGQVVFVGTDGIWETVDPEGQLFGRQRLHDLLRRHHSLAARQIVERVAHELEAFRRPLRAADDITMVVVKIA